jgi:hypothetical protein
VLLRNHVAAYLSKPSVIVFFLVLFYKISCAFFSNGFFADVTGGVHAAMVGSLHPTPIATLPFLAPHSAVVPFCEGVYKYATAWDVLREDAAALTQDVTSLAEDAAQKTGITIEQVRDRLRSVLSLTDVTRFPVPKNPQAVIFVGATVSDALRALWPFNISLLSQKT